MVLKSVKKTTVPIQQPTSEVISFADVVHGGAQAATVARKGAEYTGATATATDIEKLERYIVLVDKGISLLGRAEAIISPILARMNQQQAATAVVHQPAPHQPLPGPPVVYGQDTGARINKEEQQETGKENESGEPMKKEINPLDIAKALRMLDAQAPGITAVQIAELIEKNPDTVAKMITAFL